MDGSFLIPKEPRLLWSALLPRRRGNPSPTPVSGSPTHWLFWARNAIYHGLRALNVKPGENVLVPSYHCTSVVEPILQYGGEVKFYTVGLDLQPDFADIESKIDGKTRAVLAIHYFGFPQPIQIFKDLCRRHGLYLIEDCAHVLVGSTATDVPLGTTGDVSIFSWRKFLPVYDGGQLVINNPALQLDTRWDGGSALFSLKIAKNLLDKLMADSNNTVVQNLAKLSQMPGGLVRRMATVRGYAPSKGIVNSFDLKFDMAFVNLRMSAFSRYIMRNTDIAEVSEKRRRNYQTLAAAVAAMPGVKPVYPSIPEHVSPWIFPLLVYGVKNLHLTLRERGIPATNWSGVSHRDLPLERFPHSHFLYDNLIFLPIHQSLSDGDLNIMVGILGDVLGKRTQTDAESVDGRLSLSALSGR